MSGIYYTNPYANQYAAGNLQYMVNMPEIMKDTTSDGVKAASSLASLVPYVGPLLSAGLNMAGTAYQNYKQEQFYNEYMSPSARMSQMRAAGINPNAAAQGISGASAPNMTAAAPSSAFSAFGEQLGGSVNTALTAQAIKAGIRNTDADTNLKDSLNAEKTIQNSFLTRQQQAVLDKLVADGEVSRSMANMLKVDEAWKPAMAEASYNQLVANISQVAKSLELMESQIVHEYAAAYQSMMAGNLSEAQIHKVFSDIGLNNAMIERIQHEIPNIDANTASVYQNISESQARTMALQIQNKFQQDYYDIWQNTGFNWNSEVEKSFVGGFANMRDKEELERMTDGLEQYIKSIGNGRFEGEDYTWDKIFGLIGDFTHLGGVVYGADVISNRPTSRSRR